MIRGGWTYYVHAVKRARSLGHLPLSASGDWWSAIVGGAIEAFLGWRARNNPWTIGVVRAGYVGRWNDQRRWWSIVRPPRSVRTHLPASPSSWRR